MLTTHTTGVINKVILSANRVHVYLANRTRERVAVNVFLCAALLVENAPTARTVDHLATRVALEAVPVVVFPILKHKQKIFLQNAGFNLNDRKKSGLLK